MAIVAGVFGFAFAALVAITMYNESHEETIPISQVAGFYVRVDRGGTVAIKETKDNEGWEGIISLVNNNWDVHQIARCRMKGSGIVVDLVTPNQRTALVLYDVIDANTIKCRLDHEPWIGTFLRAKQ